MGGTVWNDEFVAEDERRRAQEARRIRRRRKEGTLGASAFRRREDRRFLWRRRRRAALSGVRLLVAVALLVVGAKAALWREQGLTERYRGLPAAADDDRAALERRLASIDALIGENPLWLGAFEASRERRELRARLLQLEREATEAALAADVERMQRLDAADSARTRARTLIEQRQFAAAIEHLREALRAAPPDWVERAQVEADLAALQALAAGRSQR